jgi:hypothetical protein
MLKKSFTTAVIALALCAGWALSQDKGGKGGGKGGAKGPGMALSSPDFPDGGVIPDKFTQADPAPVSPKLEWSNVPMGTQSFVLIMHDPDNALNKNSEDVLHWMAFNIPGSARGLNGGLSGDAKLEDGTIQAKSLRGTPGYMGPGNAAINPFDAASGSGRHARGRHESHGRPHHRQGHPGRPLQAPKLNQI